MPAYKKVIIEIDGRNLEFVRTTPDNIDETEASLVVRQQYLINLRDKRIQNLRNRYQSELDEIEEKLKAPGG